MADHKLHSKQSKWSKKNWHNMGETNKKKISRLVSEIDLLVEEMVTTDCYNEPLF